VSKSANLPGEIESAALVRFDDKVGILFLTGDSIPTIAALHERPRRAK